MGDEGVGADNEVFGLDGSSCTRMKRALERLMSALARIGRSCARVVRALAPVLRALPRSDGVSGADNQALARIVRAQAWTTSAWDR
jgi:hypothetical protein